jgi:3-isopropylmalate/(R)-2-methylmalate dehydratase small subunit
MYAAFSEERRMQPFQRVHDIAVPIAAANVNTDQIIPARFLRKQRAEGFGHYLFHDMRFDAASEPPHEHADFPLNQPLFRDAKILVAGPNFGCGSSREMAVWAIADYGIRAVIAPGFADIFFNNCVRNGVLCVVLARDIVEKLLTLLASGPGTRIDIDLERQTVTAVHETYAFDVDAFNKKCLLQGIDGIDYTLRFSDKIAAFEARTKGDARP